MLASYRPAPPAMSILSELVCTDERQRFRACEAICASVWAAGLNACATPAERVWWRVSYAQYLRRHCDVWTHETTPRP